MAVRLDGSSILPVSTTKKIGKFADFLYLLKLSDHQMCGNWAYAACKRCDCQLLDMKGCWLGWKKRKSTMGFIFWGLKKTPHNGC